MNRQKLTDRIRAALAGCGQSEINLADLGDRLDLQSREDLKKLRWALRDLVKQGDVEKLASTSTGPWCGSRGSPPNRRSCGGCSGRGGR